MENWIDIGSADELSATSLKRVTVVNREFAVSYKTAHLVFFPIPAITQADRSAKAGWMANILSALGITGNSTDVAARASQVSRMIVFLRIRSK